MDFGKLMENIEQSGQQHSGYKRSSVGGTDWQNGLSNVMSGAVPQPVQQHVQPVQPPMPADENGELLQYGSLNPDPMAGYDWGMAGEGNYYSTDVKDLGKHLGDVLPGGIGAPQADPLAQMYGDQAGDIPNALNKVWQIPGNLGEKIGGKIGRFLTVGNPFDLF